MNYPSALGRRSVLVSAPVLAGSPMGLLGLQTVEAAEQIDTHFYPAKTSWLDEPSYTPAAEGWVDVDGAKLWYQDSGGNGVPIVLLHAYTGSAASWRYQQDKFSKEGYRVIAYSRRGHYRSRLESTNMHVSGAIDLLLLERFPA